MTVIVYQNLGNDVLIKSKMGPAVLAAIDPSFEVHNEQPPHDFEISSKIEKGKMGYQKLSCSRNQNNK